MDNVEFVAMDNPLQREGRKENDNRFEKIISGFTCFQIILAIILLVFVIHDAIMNRGMFILSVFAAIILVPLFVISIVIEVITILIIKVADKNNVNKVQDYLSASTMYNSKISSPKRQIKQTKNLKKKLIILFSLLTIIVVLSIGNYFLPKYFAISETFSQVVTALNNSPYRATIIKNDPLNGIMTIRLDDDVTFDYTCEVHPSSINIGYGPFCDYRFPDGSHSIGEYIFRKNHTYIQELLAKYQNILIVDNAENVFKINDQEKMESFFSELMQNTDFNKSFKAYNNSNNASFSNSLDYIHIKGVKYKSGICYNAGLFCWANQMEFGL